MGGKPRRSPGPRKPRDLHKYTTKESLVAFLDDLIRRVESSPPQMLHKVKVNWRSWDPSWEDEVK